MSKLFTSPTFYHFVYNGSRGNSAFFPRLPKKQFCKSPQRCVAHFVGFSLFYMEFFHDSMNAAEVFPIDETSLQQKPLVIRELLPHLPNLLEVFIGKLFAPLGDILFID